MSGPTTMQKLEYNVHGVVVHTRMLVSLNLGSFELIGKISVRDGS
jgi:hypothetical protein